jgi:hypothetical protein
MRIFLSVLILIFSFQSWTKADDIRDFQIEGMSVGDSLLDHFSENDIKKELNSEYVYKYKKKFIKVATGYGEGFYLIKNFEEYDDIGITLKINDNKYLIYGISGRVFCDDGIDICFSKQKKISSDIKSFLGEKIDFSTWENNWSEDKTQKSKVYGNDFKFKDTKDIISVTVFDYSKAYTEKTKFYDHTAVTIFSKDYYDFIQNEAYK